MTISEYVIFKTHRFDQDYKHRTTADQLISDYTRTKTMNKAEKLKNNREKAILEVRMKMDNVQVKMYKSGHL